jgi:hypothetical protein
MVERKTKSVAVVMQRRETPNKRWQTEVWELVGVLSESPGGSEPRKIVETRGGAQWLYPALPVALHRDEAEGYYLNVSTDDPRVFVLWRMEEERAVPQYVTLSCAEASRWMDGGEQVDSVPMPPELYAWVGEFVEANYRPEPRQRIKPRSFMHPKDRVR